MADKDLATGQDKAQDKAQDKTQGTNQSKEHVRWTVRLGGGVAQVERSAWDALHDGHHPFVSHDFLALLEASGSVAPETGWQAVPLLVENDSGDLVAAAPAYLKSHSQGEYIFDHNWAEAWERSGNSYYPKLQIAVPFTPVPGPRLLAKDSEAAALLIRAAQRVVEQNHLSSAHATFVEAEQITLFAAAGWLIRRATQFHFENRGYSDFGDFLATLTASRRKQLRKERMRAQAAVRIENVSGDAISSAHWDAMWLFYQDTSARKWGQPYLTRAAFDMMLEKMRNSIILTLAFDKDTKDHTKDDGAIIAGALHFVGSDCLYGRYWGCLRHIPFLHFELCYYQAIDLAIARRLRRIEAGAQGGHKLARGYAPTPTWSAHFIRDTGFRQAIADFLKRERVAEDTQSRWLSSHLPFRRDDAQADAQADAETR